MRQLKNVHRIEFLPVSFYVYKAKDDKDTEFSILVERRLDFTRFKKWNDNRGGVHN